MSKHDKQVRRDRKKSNRARRHRAVRHPQSTLRHRTAALAGAVALAAGTSAYAAPVRFDNPAGPGHFNWASGAASLDLTLESALQTGGGLGPSNAYHAPSANGYVSGRDQGLEVNHDSIILTSFGSGQLIGGGGGWANYAFVDYSAYGYPGQLPEGQAAYLGVRFDLGQGFQYGWIGVIATNLGGGPPTNNIALDAFAWGYETEPGVPIAAGAPEPGSLALLAFGAAGACARRRRES